MCLSDGRVVSVNSATWQKRVVGVPMPSGFSLVVVEAISVPEKRVAGRSSGASSRASSSCRDRVSAVPFLWPGQ